MKVEQKPKFHPITITLETEEEAKLFLTALTHGSSKLKGAQKKIVADIRDCFGAFNEPKA